MVEFQALLLGQSPFRRQQGHEPKKGSSFGLQMILRAENTQGLRTLTRIAYAVANLIALSVLISIVTIASPA
ncbi:hypothetical protein [Bradyrhizobium genomosp. I (2014)]|uniref:hypothetical protein n=1 Tax=Bradyrhizobium genomosp. I (2014) TaxID=2683269 RepID=UPI0012F70E96|nr:hypothetical protein [Bradyrhizobium sp. CCBAU 43298]